jgi:hypothetical protein
VILDQTFAGTTEVFLFINIKFFESCGTLIPASRTCLILLASCPVRGAS